MRRLVKLVAFTLVLVIAVCGTLSLDEPVPSLDYRLIKYTESALTSFDALPQDEHNETVKVIGRFCSIKLPVSRVEEGNTVTEWRGYVNVTGLEAYVPSMDDPFLRLVLVGQDMKPFEFPLPRQGRYPIEFQYLGPDAEEIQVEGDLFAHRGWDGVEYHVLRATEVSPYYVKEDPRPLTEAQVELYTDWKYYHTNNTAHVVIRNLSEDWLYVGRTVSMFKDVDGSWVEVQGYPDDWLVTNEQIILFPGAFWSHTLPLYHLGPGTYRLVKEASHRRGPAVNVETRFEVVERLKNYSNATHMFGLRSINCTLPTVPGRVPVAKAVRVPVTAEDAEEIAVNVFGFAEPYEVEGNTNPSIKKGDKSLEFSTRYDVMYRARSASDLPSFNDWNRTRVVQLAEKFLSRLEPYWVDPTPLNYSITGVGPSHTSSHSTLEVGVRYQLTLEGVALEGPGADFVINVCGYEVTSCEIRRPVVAVEGYTDVTVTPEEAVRRMLRGESATPGLGFEVDQVLPRGSELTITSVTLTYNTDLSRYQEWLTPVYKIKGIAYVDPLVFGEETSSFHWYIYATEFRPPI